MPDYEAYEALLHGLRMITDHVDTLWHTLLLTHSPKLRHEGDPLFYGLADITDRIKEMQSLLGYYITEEFNPQVQDEMAKDMRKHCDLLREIDYLMEALDGAKRTVSDIAAGHRPAQGGQRQGDDSA